MRFVRNSVTTASSKANKTFATVPRIKKRLNWTIAKYPRTVSVFMLYSLSVLCLQQNFAHFTYLNSIRIELFLIHKIMCTGKKPLSGILVYFIGCS